MVDESDTEPPKNEGDSGAAFLIFVVGVIVVSLAIGKLTHNDEWGWLFFGAAAMIFGWKALVD